MSDVVEHYSILFAIIGVAIWVTTLATHKILHSLEDRQPDLLRSVGVAKVDWWLSCWKGIFLLAFSGKGRALTMMERLALRGCILSSAALLVAGVVTTAIG
ncbi:hypothetical protein [Stenotrophomonas sp.]|uniref:hypothetical protein n=1 Tax=Stenotrophomonas sp. TaxID=69392 RepID=UPI00289B303C|nr:hypothetical protein [Stenotrophomonas sp.]